VSAMGSQLGGKRLEFLKEAFPRVSRVAIFWDPTNPNNALQLRDMKASAGPLGVTLQPLEVRDPSDFEPAFSAIKAQLTSALIVLGNPTTTSYRERIIEFAAKSRLPAMYMNSEGTDAGGLMSYGPNFPDLWRRAATYVDKILKGAKPAD